MDEDDSVANEQLEKPVRQRPSMPKTGKPNRQKTAASSEGGEASLFERVREALKDRGPCSKAELQEYMMDLPGKKVHKASIGPTISRLKTLGVAEVVEEDRGLPKTTPVRYRYVAAGVPPAAPPKPKATASNEADEDADNEPAPEDSRGSKRECCTCQKPWESCERDGDNMISCDVCHQW